MSINSGFEATPEDVVTSSVPYVKLKNIDQDSLGTSLRQPKESKDYGSTQREMTESARQRSSSADARQRSSSAQEMGSSVVTCHNIHYTVDVKQKLCGATVEKKILKGIDGVFKPGMNAILGPTGSGKSSLLDVLAGRKEPKGLTGTILLDGLPPPQNFKCMVGYVVQDDVVMDTLTVRENFEFSARLRLSESVTEEERKERVNKVILELGLTEVADTKVGNEFIRGVSGGERKRCNIGMELIISPPVLFLDEPTTGLDASTANAVMLLLKKLSKKGRSIIFSIHQPRYSIYRLFDSIMLLSHGDVLYHGVSSEALNYFSTLGYECEAFNNPPDFFLDIINGDSTAITSAQSEEGAQPITNENVVSNNGDLETHLEMNKDSASLKEQFHKSAWHKKVQDELTPILQKLDDMGSNVQTRKIDYKTSFGTQLMAVSGRAIRNLYRSPQVTTLQFVIIAIFALIVGGLYYQINSSKDSGIQNRVGAFFFIVMNQVFGNMSAVELFLKERAIFMHENVSGFYRVSAYFLGKVFCDVIPMRMIPSFIFSCIAYWMIGLRPTAEGFFFFTLVLFLTTLSASALSFFISSSVRIFAMCNLFLALSYVFMMLFSGLLVNVKDLGDGISWVQYLSIFRFSLNALAINEMKDQLYCNNVTDCIPGNAYLLKQGIPYDTPWDLWNNVMALCIMTVVFMVLAYVQLRRIKKLK